MKQSLFILAVIILLPTIMWAQEQPAGIMVAIELRDLHNTSAGNVDFSQAAVIGPYFVFSENVRIGVVGSWAEHNSEKGDIVNYQAKASGEIDFYTCGNITFGAMFAVGENWLNGGGIDLVSSFLMAYGGYLRVPSWFGYTTAWVRLANTNPGYQPVVGVGFSLPFDVK